jgi:hypothetical protein
MAYDDILNLNCATYDYFDTEEQKFIILDNIEKTRGLLSDKANKNLDYWIDREINYEKIRMESEAALWSMKRI